MPSQVEYQLSTQSTPSQLDTSFLPNERSQLSHVPRTTRDITASERMIAACSGSILTSLIVTPLDVVRVRLQQQEILLPSSDCCKRQVFWDVNTCSTIDHVCITDKKLTGTFQSLLKIAEKEGLFTLWRGLSLTLLMAAPSNIVYYTGYEFLRDHSPLRDDYKTINPLFCGSFARTLAASVVSPVELLKTRLQSIPTTNSTGTTRTNVMSGLFKSVSQEIQSKGVGVLFKGLTLTLWRDVPFSGIYWASYEFLKDKFQTHLNVFDKSEYNLFFHSFISGSVSGSIAAIATNPFDVGKTRLQISNDSSTLNKSDKSMVKFMKDIVKYEGFGALYVGLLPRLLKIAPSCAIMISSYEIGKRFFATSV